MILEIRFRKNLAKLTGSSVRINSKKPKRKRTMKEKKLDVTKPGFEPASQLPSVKIVRPLTTGPCDRCADSARKLIVSSSLSLLFTLFEPYGTVFIMNSKIHLRKNSSNEHFKTISHYVLSQKFRSPFFRCQTFQGKDFQQLVQS